MSEKATVLGRKKANSITISIGKSGARASFTSSKDFKKGKKPQSTLKFEDIRIIDFTIGKLQELRELMVNAGYPEMKTKKLVRSKADVMHVLDVLLPSRLKPLFSSEHKGIDKLFADIANTGKFDKEAMRVELAKHMPEAAVEPMLQSMEIAIKPLLNETKS